MRCLVAFGLWVVASSALAGGPDYDAFSEPDGKIATVRQETAAWSMLRDPEQLEAVYADAVKGMPRAIHVMQQLEATFAASGQEVAERSSRPGCLVPVYKELSGTCRPDWSSLDYLSKDRPGGIRLREVIFGAFAARARERGLENEPILAAVNGLLSLELARGVLLKAEAAASVPRNPRVAPVSGAPLPARPGPQAQAPGGGALHPTLRPGPHAGESIPARSTSQRFTPAERAEIDRIGQTSGCHTCGTKDPGTKSGHFIPDHQPASATVPDGTPQRLYPQCINCSREQGLELARQKRGP
jgi:hypothetical protein